MRDYNKDLLNKRFKDLTSEERRELWLAFFNQRGIEKVMATATLDEICSDMCDCRIYIFLNIEEVDFMDIVDDKLEKYVCSELGNFDENYNEGMYHINWGYIDADRIEEAERELDSYGNYKVIFNQGMEIC